MKYFTGIVDGMIKFMIPIVLLALLMGIAMIMALAALILVIGGIRTLAVVFSPEKCTDTKEVIHA